MDTPGGQVSSALDICQLVNGIDVRKVAWVNPQAISAGVMISLKFPEVVMNPSAKMGDCAVILVGPNGLQPLPETERSKISSPVLAEFRDSANRNGYPEAFCEAMVVLCPAIYRIEHKQTDEVRYVFEDRLGEYNLPTQADGETVSDWRLGKKVWPENQLVTFVTEEAIEFGFAHAQVANDTQLLAYLEMPDATIQRFEANWSEKLVAFLTHPALRGLLTIVLLMGLYSEMQSPGLGLPGAVALGAAAILLGAPYLTGLANNVEILVILAGVILLGVEAFVLPGFGVAGVAGLALMTAGLLMTFVPADPSPGVLPGLPATWRAIEQGAVTLVISFIVALIGMFFLTRYFGRIPVLNKLILADAQHANLAGPVVSAGVGGTAPVALDISVGASGRAVGDLRPGGDAEIDGRVLDATTRGEWIKRGTPVRVVEVTGARIVVEAT